MNLFRAMNCRNFFRIIYALLSWAQQKQFIFKRLRARVRTMKQFNRTHLRSYAQL